MAPPKNTRGTRNPDSFLFKALTRLLSGPIVRYKTQNPAQLKRSQLDKYNFKSASGMSFKKSSYSPFDNIYLQGQANQARAERYIDFDQMEHDPLLASALDIYADEMTLASPMKPIMDIVCENQEIKEILTSLFYDTMNIQYNLFYWSRKTCKYGDFFLYFETDEEYGITNFIGLPASEVERIEGKDKENPQYVQFQWNSAGLTFERWQVAHFRIQGNDKWHPYGTSVLDSARRIWRQLNLQVDAMMAYRVTRSAERRLWKIDVNGIPEEDVEQHIQSIITETKKNMVVDPDSGLVDQRYNAFSVEEDIYMPVRGTSTATSVETLAGGQYTGDVDDVKFLQDRLLAAIKIPRSYIFETEGGGGEDKTTLSQKDIHFAQTIQRLQASMISELKNIAIVHLYTLGYRGKDLLNFELSLNTPSKIAEMQDIEIWKSRFDAAAAAKEMTSERWVHKNILKMSDNETRRVMRERAYDKRFEAALEKLLQGGEGGEDGLGGDLDLGDDLGGDLGGDAGGGDETAGGEEETLLAAPGKRHDEYTTPAAKGKRYTAKKSDSRDIGARKRSNASQYSREMGINTPRNVWKGLSDMSSLGKGIVETKDETIYENQQELNLLTLDVEVRKLINSLEKKEKKVSVLEENKEIKDDET